ncbi:hypothetical protein BBK82_04420 [Lentzea guizhouensis]|uniref:Uncharacterized protein n=1 Tax=Lentzea guizhouensis TaxID=1586287 RepID=A0A1B2HCI3_9PSEU|nr:hypothetical protein BBK82_04420 [Lentzea guizhouensis]
MWGVLDQCEAQAVHVEADCFVVVADHQRHQAHGSHVQEYRWWVEVEVSPAPLPCGSAVVVVIWDVVSEHGKETRWDVDQDTVHPDE